MKFGPCPTNDALGLILAHSMTVAGTRLKKGRRLSQADLELLSAAGIAEVTGARLDAGDVAEDEAAGLIASRLGGPGTEQAAAFTGRANLYAAHDGLLVIDTARVIALNRIDEAVTLATLPPFTPVRQGQMVATVKIIPFAAPQAALDQAAALLAAEGPALHVAAFKPARAGLIQTRVADSKDSVLAKTADVIGARLAAYGGGIAASTVIAHHEGDVAAALDGMARQGLDPLLVMGGAATVDRRDAVPAAICRAGGTLHRFGMPVDPGNLLLLGTLHGSTVIGLPGCARSPKLNGLDWVLARVLSGTAIGGDDWAAMSLGGLLKEIPSRPQPRNGAQRQQAAAPKVDAVVLAAGLSSRMGGPSKMLALLDGKPLAAHVVDAVLASRARRAIVVLGHQAELVKAALAKHPAAAVTFVTAADYAQGLSRSLKAGIRAVSPDADGVLICLGDMPFVAAQHIDRLIAAFSPADGRAICVPTHEGRRGHPVLWARRYFDEILALDGDAGAKALFARHVDALCEVAIDTPGVLTDIDTMDDLNRLKEQHKT